MPRYVILEEQGPDHAKTFTVECRVSGEAVGIGSGSSKKAAEQQAAHHQALFEALDADGDGCVSSRQPTVRPRDL